MITHKELVSLLAYMDMIADHAVLKYRHDKREVTDEVLGNSNLTLSYALEDLLNRLSSPENTEGEQDHA